MLPSNQCEALFSPCACTGVSVSAPSTKFAASSRGLLCFLHEWSRGSTQHEGKVCFKTHRIGGSGSSVEQPFKCSYMELLPVSKEYKLNSRNSGIGRCCAFSTVKTNDTGNCHASTEAAARLIFFTRH